MKEQLAEIAARKDKLLDLYMSDMFSKEQLDERVEPLKAKEERLLFAIKQLSRSNEEVQEDIAAVDETIAYLQEQRELWRKKFKTISREEKIVDDDSDDCSNSDDEEETTRFESEAQTEKTMSKVLLIWGIVLLGLIGFAFIMLPK